MYDLGKSGGDTNEPTGKLTVLTQHKEDTYKTASKEIKKVFFPKPVALKPSCWYLVKVCIHGPSSDAGGDGKRTVTGDDGIKFSFMNSKHSNNGTDARSGQIPLIIYRLASGEDDKETEATEDKKESTSVHLIKKDFAGTVSEVCSCVCLCLSPCIQCVCVRVVCMHVYVYVCVSTCVHLYVMYVHVSVLLIVVLDSIHFLCLW